MSKRTPRPALMVRVLMEIGKGRIYESWIPDNESFIHGETDYRSIRINPITATVDTLIHEALHRMEPGWDENYIRNRTSFLLKRMSDEQIQALYDGYQTIVKKRRKRGKRADLRPVHQGRAPSAERESGAEEIQPDRPGQPKQTV